MGNCIAGLLALALVARGDMGGVTVKVLSHDAGKAAEVAVRYATAAFVEGDLDRAYALIVEEGKGR